MATESANGHPEQPLPNDLPRDEEHLVTPRDLRAEKLAAALTGRTGHRNPMTVAERLAAIGGKQ